MKKLSLLCMLMLCIGHLSFAQITISTDQFKVDLVALQASGTFTAGSDEAILIDDILSNPLFFTTGDDQILTPEGMFDAILDFYVLDETMSNVLNALSDSIAPDSYEFYQSMNDILISRNSIPIDNGLVFLILGGFALVVRKFMV